jgi:hypothetical protein
MEVMVKLENCRYKNVEVPFWKFIRLIFSTASELKQNIWEILPRITLKQTFLFSTLSLTNFEAISTAFPRSLSKCRSAQKIIYIQEDIFFSHTDNSKCRKKFRETVNGFCVYIVSVDFLWGSGYVQTTLAIRISHPKKIIYVGFLMYFYIYKSF